jgi:hypothetical protein
MNLTLNVAKHDRQQQKIAAIEAMKISVRTQSTQILG